MHALATSTGAESSTRRRVVEVASACTCDLGHFTTAEEAALCLARPLAPPRVSEKNAGRAAATSNDGGGDDSTTVARRARMVLGAWTDDDDDEGGAKTVGGS